MLDDQDYSERHAAGPQIDHTAPEQQRQPDNSQTLAERDRLLMSGLSYQSIRAIQLLNYIAASDKRR